MDGEMTTSTQTTETATTTSTATSTGAAGQAAGAENGNQEKASAFKDFLDGLFGTKQEKKEPGAEEKAAEKGQSRLQVKRRRNPSARRIWMQPLKKQSRTGKLRQKKQRDRPS